MDFNPVGLDKPRHFKFDPDNLMLYNIYELPLYRDAMLQFRSQFVVTAPDEMSDIPLE